MYRLVLCVILLLALGAPYATRRSVVQLCVLTGSSRVKERQAQLVWLLMCCLSLFRVHPLFMSHLQFEHLRACSLKCSGIMFMRSLQPTCRCDYRFSSAVAHTHDFVFTDDSFMRCFLVCRLLLPANVLFSTHMLSYSRKHWHEMLLSYIRATLDPNFCAAR